MMVASKMALTYILQHSSKKIKKIIMNNLTTQLIEKLLLLANRRDHATGAS